MPVAESLTTPSADQRGLSHGHTATTPGPLLRLEALRYESGGATLFDGVELDVAAGDCVVILGPSGAGKSTLLDLIMHPQSHRHTGAVQLDHRHTALLTQDGALLDHLSVIENLRLVRRFRGRRKTADPKEVLRQLNINESLHKRSVNTLSGGERRRVAIARALVGKPRLLLFDEPDTGLDPNNIRDLARAIRELVTTQRCGVVIVTHNPWFAVLVAQRVYELDGGALMPVRDWLEPVDVADLAEVDKRRGELETHLHQDMEHAVTPTRRKPRRIWAPLELIKSVPAYMRSLFPITPSYLDYARVFSRTFYISFMSGALFFLLVGGMLGATTIAVVKLVTQDAIGGLLKYVLTPTMILRIINGSYIVFLVPAVGAILFVARSGSIMTSWLGVLVLGRQTKALRGLGVNPNSYLRAPVVLALLVGYLATALVFGIGMWMGSITTAEYLFDVDNAANLLRFPEQIVWRSFLHYKVALYSVFLTFFISGFGLAPKLTTETVALHTTKAIIYTTVAISLVELVFALDVVKI